MRQNRSSSSLDVRRAPQPGRTRFGSTPFRRSNGRGLHGGPSVAFDVAATPPPPKKKFPWWLVIVLAVLLVVVIIAFLALK